MNAAIVLIRDEIAALRERRKDTRPYSHEEMRVDVALEELGDALDLIYGLDKSGSDR